MVDTVLGVDRIGAQPGAVGRAGQAGGVGQGGTFGVRPGEPAQIAAQIVLAGREDDRSLDGLAIGRGVAAFPGLAQAIVGCEFAPRVGAARIHCAKPKGSDSIEQNQRGQTRLNT